VSWAFEAFGEITREMVESGHLGLAVVGQGVVLGGLEASAVRASMSWQQGVATTRNGGGALLGEGEKRGEENPGLKWPGNRRLSG